MKAKDIEVGKTYLISLGKYDGTKPYTVTAVTKVERRPGYGRAVNSWQVHLEGHSYHVSLAAVLRPWSDEDQMLRDAAEAERLARVAVAVEARKALLAASSKAGVPFEPYVTKTGSLSIRLTLSPEQATILANALNGAQS